ncbi:MAG TPA: hypothetical protein VF418_07785 [Sphingomonadaceae bacterium]
MTFWTAMVMIALIVSVASVIGSVANARLRAQRGLRVDWKGEEVPIAPHETGANAAHRREIEDLRERVKVLERIVTDGRDARSVAEQIESLRDR